MNTFFCKCFYVAAFFGAAAFASDDHHNPKFLYGDIETQYVCHDGANRGATVRVMLGLNPDRGDYDNHFVDLGAKTYYTATTCLDLGEYSAYVKPGTVIYAWYSTAGPSIPHDKCHNFRLVYAENERTIWIQNAGTVFMNVTCVARNSLD